MQVFVETHGDWRDLHDIFTDNIDISVLWWDIRWPNEACECLWDRITTFFRISKVGMLLPSSLHFN